MIIRKVTREIIVYGIVQGNHRPRGGTYDISVASGQFKGIIYEWHLNRGGPSAKRKFQVNCKQDTEQFFKTIQDAVSVGVTDLKIVSGDIVAVVHVETVRKEIRILAEGSSDIAGSQRADVIVDGTCIGTISIYIPEPIADDFEAIVTEIGAHVENQLLSAFESGLPCVFQITSDEE